MRTSTPIVSSLVAAALALAPVQVAFAAPEEGESAEGAAEGEATEGETPEGEAAEGEGAEGETPEGEAAEGETPEGEAAEGETPEGEAAEGETPEGEAAEGETPEGEAAEGEAAEGEATEGEAAEGEAAEGEAAEGEAAEGESSTPSFLEEDDGRPPEPRIANKPAKGKGLMIAGGTVAGVGLAMTLTFGLMTRNCSIDGPLQCGLQNQDDFLIPMGAATLLTGMMVLGVGVGYRLRYKKWESWSPEDDKKAQLIPTPTAFRGGGGLSWAGRF